MGSLASIRKEEKSNVSAHLTNRKIRANLTSFELLEESKQGVYIPA